MTTLVPTCDCPHCGSSLDAVTPMDHDSRPEPGDVTLCVCCGGASEFDDDLLLIKADTSKFSAEEMDELVAIRVYIESMKTVH